MTLRDYKNWKAVHFENRVILRSDRNLYSRAAWQALVFDKVKVLSESEE